MSTFCTLKPSNCETPTLQNTPVPGIKRKKPNVYIQIRREGGHDRTVVVRVDLEVAHEPRLQPLCETLEPRLRSRLCSNDAKIKFAG